MTGDADRKAVFAAAMSIAAQGRWRDCRLSDIATEANIALTELERIYGDSNGVLNAFSHYLDDQVRATLDDAIADPDIPLRERLLETLLARFEAMHLYRPGIAGILRLLPTSPALGLGGLNALHTSMQVALTVADASPNGLSGQLRTKGLVMIFLDALPVWIKDDSDDLSATARRLDERLRQAEWIIKTAGLDRPESC